MSLPRPVWRRPAPALAVLVALLAPAATSADACRWLSSRAARRVLELSQSADAWMDFAALRPAPLPAIAVRDLGGGSAELLVDGRPVDDLHGIYVRDEGGEWLDLGAAAGCASERLPSRVPREPLAPAPAGAATAPPPARWIALAELPTVLPQWEPRAAAPVEVRVAPDETAPVVRFLRPGDELPTAEWSYEQAGAFVLEERGEWVRLRLADGSGWMRRTDAAPVHSWAELVVDGLAYLTAAWDGRLYDAPDARATARAIDSGWRERLFEPDQVPIDAVEIRAVDGATWLRVRVTSPHCHDGEPPHVWAEGWLPLAGRDGEPAVGFYSRGC